MTKKKAKSRKAAAPQPRINQNMMIAIVAVIVVVIGGGLILLNSGTPQNASGAANPTPGQYSGTLAQICEEATPAADPASRSFTAAERVLETGVDYRAVFCLETGPVYIDLFEREAPETVNNLIFLAQNGYYNNTTFHRVLEDFMAQGGDPTGTGTGGPGYQFRDEIVSSLTFNRQGLLAMANSGPGTNGSQFFITTAETPWLDGRHTIFGIVLEGQSNVESLRLRDPQQNPSFSGSRLETIVIIDDPADVEGQ